MTLGTLTFVVEPVDTVCIAPGVEHGVENTGSVALTILCMCAPAYAHVEPELTGLEASTVSSRGK